MSGAQKVLDLAALHKVRQLFHKTVQPLTLAELANTQVAMATMVTAILLWNTLEILELHLRLNHFQ